MSSSLHYEIARVEQSEIARRTVNAYQREDQGSFSRPGRPFARRVTRAAAVFGVCLAATGAVADTGALAHSQAASGTTPYSAQRLAGHIAALEANGYTEASCKVNGMLMVNQRTGKSQIVR
jgi:hypothetical protein